MKTEFRCPRCGQAFTSNQQGSGNRAICVDCGPEQVIVECGDSPPPELSSYQLASVAFVPSVTQPARSKPHARATEYGHSSRFPWLDQVRPWIFESSHVQGFGTWLVILSAADLFMTFTLLRRSAAFFESNPIAQWFFVRWNMTGMVFFKFSLIAGVILLSEIIERKRPGLGRFVLLVGCLGAAYAVVQGGRLYYLAETAPLAVDLD